MSYKSKLLNNANHILSSLSAYLFLYHISIATLLYYFHIIGTLKYFPGLTYVLFGAPFISYLFLHMRELRSTYKLTFYYLSQIIVLVITCYCVLIILWNYLFNHISFYHSIWNFSTILWYVIMFTIGLHLKINQSNYKWYLFTFFFMITAIFFNINFELNSMTVGDNEPGIMHLLGDGFTILTLLLIAHYRDRLHILIFLVIGLIATFYISSRASLYGLMALAPFIFWKSNNVKVRLGMTIFLVIGGVIVYFLKDELASQRMLKFLVLGDDLSLNRREVIFQNNINDLWDNWFLGDYLGQLKLGKLGYYIHNYLSVWRQYGIIPFILFLTLFYPFYLNFIKWLKRTDWAKYNYLFYISIFTILQITLVRSYKYYFVWLALGMLVKFQKELDDQKSSKRIDTIK